MSFESSVHLHPRIGTSIGVQSEMGGDIIRAIFGLLRLFLLV